MQEIQPGLFCACLNNLSYIGECSLAEQKS